MKLLWSPRSPFVRKVSIAAEELDLGRQIERIRCLVPTTDPDHMVFEHNPLGAVPVLILEDGSSIIGSGNIIEALDGMAGGGRLIPTQAAERQLALLQQTMADGMMDQLVPWQGLMRRGVPAHQEPFITRAQIKLQKVLGYLEREAAPLAARPFDIGGLSIGVMLSYLDFRHDWCSWRTGRPVLSSWYERVNARASFIATVYEDEVRPPAT